jgi:RPA family protein
MENIQEPTKQITRQTAKVSSIGEITKGNYIKQEGWEPNYILSLKNEKISRVNLIGIVVTIPENSQSVFLDDGTGKIEVRSFEKSDIFKDITIGDIVLIIGRPRDFNNEIYINVEIIKKITNKGWLEYRKKEILLRNILKPDMLKEVPEKNFISEDNVEGSKQEESKLKEETIDEIDELLIKIKNLDTGSGCDVQELIEINQGYEAMVEQLLLKGEIFELAPGKIKVLE